MSENKEVFEQLCIAKKSIWKEIRAGRVSNVFSIGSLVRIANYSPFHGRKGIIRKVDCIFDDGEDPFCFYLVAVEGTQLKEPMWFEYDEVELIASVHVALDA